ncbi:Cytoplasmic dynein 2 heavy chain 1 [Armadillidium vulgare]|nr:Cytoplasmic dynein 2 heavy chain 1 [Armadillidium vulgare]
MRMVDAEFNYTYEYQGNAPKLVHTPLTDKCYLTLTQGMHMGLGGNPYGPAGTGKTESVKALGSLFGRQVLVFNCDEGIDVRSMGRIFVGLVKCGAWGCFDEFNRLEEAVLSAVSMQIQTIQASIKSKAKTTLLLDKEVPVDPNSGIFITLNPAGKGYGGRQKLPDNLKQLFRPVAMSRPDNELIAEVILFSEGYVCYLRSRALFKVTCAMYVLIIHIRFTYVSYCAIRKNIFSFLMQLSEVIKNIKFDDLVKDVFPGTHFRGVGYEQLAEVLKETFEDLGLIPNEKQIKKALELYEQLQQRMGVVIVGPSGSGKTTLWKTLCQTLLKIDHKVKRYVVNPKAIPRHQLLGHIDHDTREWSDGVITASARQVVKEPIDVTSWIICDGDIDPEWIESLNSVLDDNRLLTMPSGERIQFGPNVNFLFETHDLSSASPATISRMGMIFLSDEDTDIRAVVLSWLKTQSEEGKKYLEPYIDQYFFKALNWVLSAGESHVDTSLVGWVWNGLSHLSNITSKTHFALGLIRGLGGNLPEPQLVEFAQNVFSWVGEHSPDPRKPLNVFYNENRDTLESYSSENIDTSSLSINDNPIIMTASAKASLDSFNLWLQPETSQPFILVGPEGCGKSLLLDYCFSQLRSAQVAKIHCSAYTEPEHVLQKLSQLCMVISTNTGRVLRPKDCERLILYLKDLNLPKPDKWGTCQLITFLQQVVTYRGYYDSNLEWVGLEGIQIVASMTSGSGLGRHKLSTRFTSVVRIASIGYPDRDQLVSVYQAYLHSAFKMLCPGHSAWQNKTNELAASMVHVYKEVREAFTVDDYSHYLFTPRDLTRWVKGLMRYEIPEGDKSLEPLLEVLEMFARVDRVLTSPGGSLLMAGRSGVGRRTAVVVMANFYGMKVISPSMAIGYDVKQFRNDLKQVTQVAGVDGEQVLFLLEDHHLISSAFLEIVNSLLMAGEVPGLYTQEELDPLLGPLRDQAAHEGFRGSQYAYFASRIQKNLHIALIMDSSNPEFIARCESNPALYKQCTVLWDETWSPETLLMIPDLFLEDDEKTVSKTPDFLQKFLAIHDSLPEYLASPRRYLEFLKNYQRIFNEKRNGVIQRQSHLQAGVSKLNEAKEVVKELEAEAAEKEVVLNEKQSEANKALQLITDTMTNANKHKTEMERLKEQTVKENENIAQRKAVETLLKNKANSFEPAVAKRASAAAAPLAAWVKANVKFSYVLIKVKPLEEEQNALQKNLTKAEHQIEELSTEVADVAKKVSVLKDKLNKSTKEATELEFHLNKAKDVMNSARNLVSKLDGEYTRWNEQVSELSQSLENLPNEAALAAAFITYLSNAPEDVRKVTMAHWTTQWLQEHLKGSTVEVTNQQDPKFGTTLELAVRFGKTLIIQEIDQIEPILYPLLRGDLISQGPRFVVELGEKSLDYNPSFKLYLATRNPQPELPPDTFGVVTFSQFYNNKSWSYWSELLRQEEDLRVQLVNLEEQLLISLAESSGNILENKTLLESLEQAKSSSATIESSLKESVSLQESLETERKSYLPLAQAASNLYFVILDLSKQNNMYRFSLTTYLNLFHKAMKSPVDGSGTENRIQSLQRTLIDLVFSYISRSLFKADRLMFALHLVHGMYPELFKEKEWDLFTGTVVTDVKADQAEIKASLPKWIDEERGYAVALLRQTFPELYKSLTLEDSSVWSGFANSSHCEVDFPVQMNNKLTQFQKLLVVQAIRPDRLQSALMNFASKALGLKELSPPTLNFKRLLPETVATEPILIIISPGADPSQEILDVVRSTVGMEKYQEVAMGQGQSEIALSKLRESAQNGHWLCLKNLHLVTIWLPLLEKALNSLQPHEEFRLWLTAEPHPKFTPILLQSSLKITYEAPAGIKKNLQRTYDSWSPELIARGNNVNKGQSLFVLAWFHAVVQERRTYIPQGWSKFYEFSLADLKAGADILDRLYSNSDGELKWNTIHGLFENAIYGGRVDNVWDGRVLTAYLELFFNNEVIAGKRPAAAHLAPNLNIPTTVNYQDYTQLISSLPDDDEPVYFGLPANIERSWQRIASSQVISQLKGRALAIVKWNAKSENGSLLRDPLDLSDLLHPATFINALRQQTAREHNIPMDDLEFVTSWARGGMPEAKVPVKWAGLQIEGATFDGTRLLPNNHNSPSISVTPICTIAWMPKESESKYVPRRTPNSASLLLGGERASNWHCGSAVIFTASSVETGWSGTISYYVDRLGQMLI